MPARPALVAAFGLAFFTACRRPADLTGLYANRIDSPRLSRGGLFFPCAGSPTPWMIQDSALAARYSSVATQPGEFVFAHLEGLREDSGSVYGSQPYFRVRHIIELRLRTPEDCLGAGAPLPTPLRDSAH